MRLNKRALSETVLTLPLRPFFDDLANGLSWSLDLFPQCQDGLRQSTLSRHLQVAAFHDQSPARHIALQHISGAVAYLP